MFEVYGRNQTYEVYSVVWRDNVDGVKYYVLVMFMRPEWLYAKLCDVICIIPGDDAYLWQN